MDSVPAYIASLPQGAQAVADEVRRTIRDAAPGCVEVIRYDMPAFQLDGRTFLYFGVWKNHVGLYPIYKGSEAFERDIGPFRARKDTVQFPLNKPVPFELIARIVASQLSPRPAA